MSADSPISVSADRPARCEGRYPVPQTSPPRDEPFGVTYRCAKPKGHDGPHGQPEDVEIPAADRPVENSELRELIGEMAKQASLGHRQFCVGVHVHESGGEESEWISWTDAFESLVSRLRADRLTDDEAAWLATMIGDEYESITDRGTSALSKIRRISEEGNPK